MATMKELVSILLSEHLKLNSSASKVSPNVLDATLKLNLISKRFESMLLCVRVKFVPVLESADIGKSQFNAKLLLDFVKTIRCNDERN